MIVVYDFEINAIISEPIKTRQAPTICDKFLKMHKILKSRGKNPKSYIMYNEFSSYLKEAINKYGINFQLALPNIHRQNAS